MIACEKYIDDCIKDGNHHCISLSRDCADICTLCARFDARDSEFVEDLHALCAKICKACAVESSKHAKHHASCKECADACEKCAKICEELATTKAGF